ncbi:MAG: hypothetical protein AAGM33_04220, partial [Pseudomonadota bacterium]
MTIDEPRQTLALFDSPEEAVARLEELYQQQIDMITARFGRYTEGDLDAGDTEQGVYPMISV